MIKFKNITFSYDKKHNALHDVSFDTPEKGLVTIVGENGSGKTTLMNLISNKTVFNGEIFLNNKNVKEYKSSELAEIFSFLPQKLSFPENVGVYDVISIGRSPFTNIWGSLSKKDKDIIDKYAKLMNVDMLYDKMFNELSGGQQQRVAITMSLCQETPILIFDEPTNHLDIRYQLEIFELVNKIKNDRLVIITTHNINMASKYSDQFVFLKKGELIDKGTKDIITTDNIRKLFNVESEINIVKGSPIIIDMEIKDDETKR